MRMWAWICFMRLTRMGCHRVTWEETRAAQAVLAAG